MIVNHDEGDYPKNAPEPIQNFYKKITNQIVDHVEICLINGTYVLYEADDSQDLHFYKGHLRIEIDVGKLEYINKIVPYGMICDIEIRSHL